MDIESLLRSLNDHAVEYVVIGAMAFPVHGYTRTTQDTDIFIRPTPENAARVMKALEEFGYDISDLTLDDLLTKKVLIRQYIVESDFHPEAKGTTFDRVWARKVEAVYGDTPAFFASLDDLIEMKRAAGRPRDLEDLKVLLELRRRREAKGEA